MPGDATPPLTAAAGGDGSRERKGPRHAAPRKSLLTKFHLPASKAIALAAMPTAVFVGMGLTPKLALADDKEIPFAPGPCVTRSDEPSESASPSASESAKPSESPAPTDTAEPEPTPSATSGGGADDAAQEPNPAESPSAPAAGAEQKAPAPEPSASETENPLDPLGVGDKVEDFFDGVGDALRGEPEPTPTPSPTGTATEPAEEPAVEEPAAEKPAAVPADEPAEEPAEKATDAVGDTVDKTKEAIKEAADEAGAEVEELDEDVKGLDPKKDEDIPEGAKPRFPCPTADPEALAAAEVEPGLPLLPDDPWILESSMLTLTGLDYHGIVEVKTGSGKIKKVLKFTASGVDIKDLHQLVVGPNGTTVHVEARKGSTSTIRNGTVTMYTEELKGNLFGIIPITFSPQTPPPLNVPFAMFTDVKVTQAGQFGGTLTVPGLHNYFTGGNA
ncbi:hypothetical protein [Streptomyces xantholiticus]|uniref:hypothetical protein n=1 Tax=Streptomyces xantholiticus TaxID=68285 RepID=UPI00167B2746|nr:hypothetical protein [Streptomyces xantholiticus]GGW47054.1 hypothetical protein GCM10010381_35350 [Streptomyces xantholiticus]